jgi:hypothetical protein
MAQNWALDRAPDCLQRCLLAEPWVVVGQDRLHLAVDAFGPWGHPLVKRRQGAAGRAVVVAAGSVGGDGVEGLEKETGNPAGWPPYKVGDIMDGNCLVSNEIVEEWRPRSQCVPLPLEKGVSRMINAPGQLTDLEDHNDLLQHNPLQKPYPREHRVSRNQQISHSV